MSFFFFYFILSFPLILVMFYVFENTDVSFIFFDVGEPVFGFVFVCTDCACRSCMNGHVMLSFTLWVVALHACHVALLVAMFVLWAVTCCFAFGLVVPRAVHARAHVSPPPRMLLHLCARVPRHAHSLSYALSCLHIIHAYVYAFWCWWWPLMIMRCIEFSFVTMIRSMFCWPLLTHVLVWALML